MKVMKFGGTSVGSADRMKHVAELAGSSSDGDIMVLSAMSGTTNTLLEIADYLYNRNPEGALDTIARLARKYSAHISELYSTEEYRTKAQAYVDEVFAYLSTFAKQLFTAVEEKIVVAQGELISTHLMLYHLMERGVDVKELPALDFMKIDRNGDPDADFIKDNLAKVIAKVGPAHLYITQGFICKNCHDEVDNLLRGGSDYTASLVGAAAGASVIEIWTDIDGMHNNDPRIVEGTAAVSHLSFDEAAELAYFGAKILHPTCIQPAKFAGIPVRLKNTLDPDAAGTLIDNRTDSG